MFTWQSSKHQAKVKYIGNVLSFYRSLLVENRFFREKRKSTERKQNLVTAKHVDVCGYATPIHISLRTVHHLYT